MLLPTTLSAIVAVGLLTPRILTTPALVAGRRMSTLVMDGGRMFTLTDIPLGKAGTANIRFKPTVAQSEAVVVRYNIPFGLNVESQGGRAICTKDGQGGEKVGDILRFTTQWTMGLPRGDGLVSTVASFGGAIGWQVNLFDVSKAKTFDEVVEALVSNRPERTDQVTLIFERPTA
mmetsp:Transcript_25701/g.83018  ORF Transcript_25701/g.83018 Transcript_25701/m.83018 type:complete len:175 (-) Transcript_25701:372-896(-)